MTPDFENFPCGNLEAEAAEAQELMTRARSCPACRGGNLLPVSDCLTPPTIAIACQDCGEIEGDAPTLIEAVTSWNSIRRPSS